MPVLDLRIVLLDCDTDVWCDWCGLSCATLITYVVERVGDLRQEVHRLRYCEGCEAETNWR